MRQLGVANKLLRLFAAFFLFLAASSAAWAQLVAWPPAPLVKLAVNPASNKVYLLDEANDAVIVLNAATGATTTVAVGDRPVYVAVNPVTNRIYVNNAGDSSLTVIDGATDTNLTPTPLPLGSLGPIIVNPRTNIVYIVRLTGPGTDEVTFFNGADHGWYTIATESFQPISITVNPVTNTLYVAHYATGDVRVISAEMDGNAHPTTFSIGVWSRPFAIAANPVTNKVYVLTEDARGPIAIIDGATRTATFPTIASGHAAGPKNLAVNPVTNKIYAAFNDEVVVIDGATGALTYIPVNTGTGPAEVGINTATNKVYVANSSGTLTVIDGSDNTTTTVPIVAGVNSLGVNPITNEVFVYGDGGLGLVEGSGSDAANTTPLTVTIAPKPADTTGPATEFSMTAASGFSPNALPVRKVYVQLDSTEGAWTQASGSGPYSAAFTGLTPGNHVLYAFATDGQDAPLSTGAQSNPLVGRIASYAFSVSTTAAKVDPSVSLASSRNPARAGETITLTANVAGSAGAATGTVEFRDGSVAIAGCGSVSLSSGTATCTTSALAVGSHSITAHYSGDASYNAAASSAIPQQVQPALVASSTALSSSANPSTTGQAVTFTATVSGSSGTATGSVEFRRGSEAISGCAAVALASGGATCATSALTAGSHSITAHYSGDGTYSGSASLALVQTVEAVTGSNVALASAGATATASSTYGSWLASRTIDNERAGTNWANGGGGWVDATPGTYPDWLQVSFSGNKSIDRVVVYTLQDNYNSPAEPTDSMTFTTYGIRDFTVQGWNGSSWVTLATVTGNNLVKRTVGFSAFTTDRIRVNVTNGGAGYSRITEVEAWGEDAPTPPPSVTNVALATAGATASASSTYGSWLAARTIDNERAGTNWANGGGGWVDATPGAYPDWLQVSFNGNKSIDRVVVYTLQDNYNSPAEPTDAMTFTTYGIRDFTVEGWNGSAWVTLATVTGNSLVKRTLTFPAFTTDRIRVNVTNGGAGYSRITEVEAWGEDAPATPPSGTNVALSTAGATASASSTYGSWLAARTIDNERAGANWANGGGGWVDATPGSYPDWLQVTFSGSKTIDRVVVYTLQDNYNSPSEPTDSMTFTTYGIRDFVVQGWNGSSWVTLATVSGNSLVKRTVSFGAFTTDRIRVNVTNSGEGYSRITEVEAWGS